MKARLVTGVLCLLVLSACATTPSMQDNTALQNADTAIEAASEDQNVHKYAAVELEKAKDTLDRAKTTWHDTGDRARTNHLVYMARRRAQIAEAVAQKGKAQAQSEAAGKKRKNLRIQELRSKLAELKPRQTDEGIVLTLGNVLFAFDSAKLNSQAQEPLDKLARFLHAHAKVRVRVKGYTDSTGSRAYNQRLSERRAQSVAGAMIQRGIDPTRMTVTGYGEADPVASNSTAAGRQQNRRVEFVLLNRGQQGSRENGASSPRGSNTMSSSHSAAQ